MEQQAATAQAGSPTPGLAIASLVCGIGGSLTGPLTGIPAIVTGHMALSRIRRSGDSIQGKGMAISGLVLGYVSSILISFMPEVSVLDRAFGAAAIINAKQATSLSAATSLETAADSYFTEYGALPKEGTVDTVVRTDKDLDFLNELLGHTGGGARSLNTRSIKFLSAREGTNGKHGLIYSADGRSVEGLFDPWGGPYHVALDLDYDGKVKVPSQSGTMITLERRAGAWSGGPDGMLGTADDVTTW